MLDLLYNVPLFDNRLTQGPTVHKLHRLHVNIILYYRIHANLYYTRLYHATEILVKLLISGRPYILY